MSRKRKLLVWSLVFIIILTGIAWTGCGKSEPEATTESKTTQEFTGPPQFTPGEGRTFEGGLMTRTSGILPTLANIDDDVINQSIQEALDEGTITEKQAEDIKLWWAIRPEVLNTEVFPMRMPEVQSVPTE